MNMWFIARTRNEENLWTVTVGRMRFDWMTTTTMYEYDIYWSEITRFFVLFRFHQSCHLAYSSKSEDIYISVESRGQFKEMDLDAIQRFPNDFSSFQNDAENQKKHHRFHWRWSFTIATWPCFRLRPLRVSSIIWFVFGVYTAYDFNKKTNIFLRY